jgi:hypothetical protein
MSKPVRILQNNGKIRTIGNIEGDTFYSKRKKSKHFFRKANAWGIDNQTLNDLEVIHGVKNIVIVDTESGKRYKTTVDNFKEKGFYLNYKDFNKQIFLGEEDWNVKN